MEFDTTNFTEEEIGKVNELINSIKKEKETQKKWWIMPNFDIFEQFNINNPSIGLNYFIEEQKDSYSRSRPPLKSDFNSKEEAEEWLKNYLKEEEIFKSAQDELDNLVCNLGLIRNNDGLFEYYVHSGLIDPLSVSSASWFLPVFFINLDN